MTDPQPSSPAPKRIYLAGPEVFFPEAVELGARKKAICEQYGFTGQFPLDTPTEPTPVEPSEIALAIFAICIQMMDACDLVIANMTPFRGVSMDVGTAVELGYMHAQGKPVFGYTNVAADYKDRVAAAKLAGPDEVVEDYGFSDNLMCEGPVRRSHGEVVRRLVPAAQLFTALDGFEACVQQARRVMFDF